MRSIRCGGWSSATCTSRRRRARRSRPASPGGAGTCPPCSRSRLSCCSGSVCSASRSGSSRRRSSAPLLGGGDLLRHHHPPGVEDVLLHLLKRERAEARDDPVEAHVRLARHEELLGPGLDEQPPLLARESEAQHRLVLREREV